MIRIANACGFYGDQLDAPAQLVQQAEIDVLTLEYLAELTLSILARQREKNPQHGFASEFLQVLGDLAPSLQSQPGLQIITNAGGMNPLACARRVGEVLHDRGLSDIKIGTVTGDDLLSRLRDGRDSFELEQLAHAESGAACPHPVDSLVAANAYLGSQPLVKALQHDARIVITGRIADAALTVAPLVHRYGWDWDDWDRLGQATTIGHLIECGAQVTGGYRTDWNSQRLSAIGYPIAEVGADGEAIITKPQNTDGCVSRQSVIEQLIYEIGDPAAYLTPDVVADFSTVNIEQAGVDRVRVYGGTGKAATEHYKVSTAYRDGFTTSAWLVAHGADGPAKARATAQLLLDRTQAAGYQLDRTHVELLGGNHQEVVLRIAVQAQDRAAVERFRRELPAVATTGPAGLAGYTSAQQPVRPMFAYWPALTNKSAVDEQVQVDVATAEHWATTASSEE